MHQDGGSIVASTLKELSVPQLYTLCGGHISPILAGCKKQGIKVIDVRDEANAVFAADATSRLTGVPGVAAVTAGPGVTNTLTAVKNAQLAHSPLILLGGASATVLRGRGSLQDIDQMTLIKPHVKYSTTIGRVRDIEPEIKKAFQIATSGVPGPVFIELPIDILYPEKVVREWYGIKGGEQSAGSLGKRAIQMYLNFHAQQMFAEPGLPQFAGHIANGVVDSVSLLAEKGRTSLSVAQAAKKAAQSVTRSKRPVMVLGSQVTQNPASIGMLQCAIERVGIPVFLSGMARGILGTDHRLQLRHKRKLALKDADLVILAGVPCDFRLDYGNHIAYKSTYISANLSKEDLFKNRTPDIAAHARPAEFLEQLAEMVDGGIQRKHHHEWLAQLKNTDEQRNSEIKNQAKQPAEHINPVRLLSKLDELLPENSVIVADGGDFVGTAAYTLRPRGALRWLDPGVFGTLGVGGGFAMGAAMHYPDSEIWLIYGDGSSAFSLAEFDTFVRHGIGVIALIGNDACWNQIARDQIEILHDDVGTVLRHTDYHVVAEGFGGVGILLDDPKKITMTIRRAQKFAQQGRPVLINAILDKSDFRKGSISV